MHDLFNAVSKNKLLKGILPHLPRQTYLVGGCVRDLMLGAVPSDFDLVTFGTSMDLARQLGAILGGKAFFMDQERQVARVALKHGDLTIDVSPPKGNDIEADLLERDITINAMALDPFSGTLIDPLGGQQDLQEKRIRLIAEKNLQDDPLRGLRCLRFSVQLGFSLDRLTMEVIRKNAETLGVIAPERIKYEFLKVLMCPASATFFSLLVDAGYTHVLFKDMVDEDRLRLSLELLSGVELLLSDAPSYLPGIKDPFADELEHGFTRSGALRLAGFFAGMAGLSKDHYNHSLVNSWCTRLALSSLASRNIAKTISGMSGCLTLTTNPFSAAAACTGYCLNISTVYRKCSCWPLLQMPLRHIRSTTEQGLYLFRLASHLCGNISREPIQPMRQAPYLQAMTSWKTCQLNQAPRWGNSCVLLKKHGQTGSYQAVNRPWNTSGPSW